MNLTDHTDPLILLAGERHVLRVFALDMPAPQAAALVGDSDTLARLLGLPAVNPAGVEVIDLADLAGVGLVRYLTEGDGIAEAALAADAAALTALQGWVLILRSQAVATPTTLQPAPTLRLIGRYAEEELPLAFEPLPSAAAVGLIPQGKPPMSDARIGGMVATVVLVLMAIFTTLFVYLAGR